MLKGRTDWKGGAIRRSIGDFRALQAVATLFVALHVGSARAEQSGRTEAKRDAGASDDARPSTDSNVDTPLRVGFGGSAPFVLPDQPAGLSVAVWRAVADRAGLPYTLTRQPSVAQAVDKVDRGELDVAIGPISITAERARRVGFTQPYYQSSLAIAAPQGSAGMWARLSPFLTWGFAGATGILLLILGIVGLLTWVFERRKNPEQFPPDPVRGIGNGIWFALVTMTTVGYGDRVPVTVAGRVVAGAWMVVAILTATSLLAGIASAITVSQLDPAAIRVASDLSGKKVAVVRRTTGAAFARSHGAVTVPVDDLPALFDLVTKGKAHALISDRPMINYYLSQHPDIDLVVSPRQYEPQGYGFATSLGPEGAERLNIALLEAKEDEAIERAVTDWLGSEE